MNVFLITTAHNEHTRWDHAKSQMLGLTHIPFLAPDYRLFQFAGLSEKRAKHQSLTMAYLQIAQAAIFAGESQYMVVEDDISFCPGFEDEMIKTIDSTPKDWDFLYLTQTPHNKEASKIIPVNDYICKVIDNHWETPITVWGERLIKTFNERMMQKLNEDIWTGHIDHELLKICQEGTLNFYAATKNLANGLSTVRHLASDKISFEGSIS